jgi:hypothetical protein
LPCPAAFRHRGFRRCRSSRLAQEYLELGLENPAVIVDTNHANSDKRIYEQPRIAREVLLSRRYDPELRRIVTVVCDTGQRYLSGELFGERPDVEEPEREHAIDDHTLTQLALHRDRLEFIV